jgi:hypothetical protein
MLIYLSLRTILKLLFHLKKFQKQERKELRFRKAAETNLEVFQKFLQEGSEFDRGKGPEIIKIKKKIES